MNESLKCPFSSEDGFTEEEIVNVQKYLYPYNPGKVPYLPPERITDEDGEETKDSRLKRAAWKHYIKLRLI